MRWVDGEGEGGWWQTLDTPTNTNTHLLTHTHIHRQEKY